MYEFEREAAVRAIIKASRLCRAVQSELSSDESMRKEDKSPVTVADYGSQAVVINELNLAFPDDPIAAEEDASVLRTKEGRAIRDKILKQVNSIDPGLDEQDVLSAIDLGNHKGGTQGRFWALDPIDGTKGFLRRDQYAIALALIEKGEVVLGVLGCPNLPVHLSHSDGPKGCLFAAVKGEGTVMRLIDEAGETPVSVTGIDDPRMAAFCESVVSAHSSHSDSAEIAEILGVSVPPIRIDSQCKYGALARGDASIYLRLPTDRHYMEKIWDHAAGSIIVKEAGGEVTDAFGEPLDFSLGLNLKKNTGIVGTNGKLHQNVIAASSRVLKSHHAGVLKL